MEASELVKKIEVLINKHGDLDVKLELLVFTGGTSVLRSGLECMEVHESDGFIQVSADGYA